jgi:hypothetical protein
MERGASHHARMHEGHAEDTQQHYGADSGEHAKCYFCRGRVHGRVNSRAYVYMAENFQKVPSGNSRYRHEGLAHGRRAFADHSEQRLVSGIFTNVV